MKAGGKAGNLHLQTIVGMSWRGREGCWWRRRRVFVPRLVLFGSSYECRGSCRLEMWSASGRIGRPLGWICC